MSSSNGKFRYGFVVAAAVFAASSAVFAQADPTAPPAKPAPKVVISTTPPPRPPAVFGAGSSERSIAVDPAVNLSLCVTQGTVTVNGWNRNELRVYVQGDNKFGFKVAQKSVKTGEPVWVMVMGTDARPKYAGPSECIGGEIEIDLPTGATVNLKGQETTTTIDGIRRASVKTIGGDISVRNVNNGVTASAGQGDITVEGSTGAMSLDSTTGNIVAFETGPGEIGDTFKAKTSGGTISLQKVEHRQIEANSISGSVVFNGELLGGGSYTFGTSNGSIRLTLPKETSCVVQASYGFGAFNSELPIKIETENVSEGPIKSMVGRLGSGDASLKLTTINGSIAIKKQ